MRIRKRKRVYYAVGDVHGMSFKLAKMMRLIEADAKQYQDRDYIPVLVMLGDYVDRGPDSKGVIDLLIKGIPGFLRVYLGGNHELMMSHGLVNQTVAREIWLPSGGTACLESYGYDWKSDPRQFIPDSHIDFFADLRTMFVTKKYVFVHAGIDPRVSLTYQTVEDEDGVLWIGKRFLNYDKKFEGNRIVIHGHRPSLKGPVIKHNRICLDTGACHRGKLTCAVLTNKDEPRFISV